MMMLSTLLTIAQFSYEYDAPDSSHLHVVSPGFGSLDHSSVIGLMIIVLAALIGLFVQSRMLAAMKRFSSERVSLTGAQVARRMLDAHGLNDVRITHVKGQLTDHYNPANRTVNLSDAVYSQATVAAMAVAAHECGHAVQHATAYVWLGLRSSMVPMVNIGSRLGQVVLMIGLALVAAGSGALVAWIGLGLFASATVFALVTLPVEFDASRRALAWIKESELASYAAYGHAQSSLRWAAMTYVAAALSSLAMLVYYALRLLSSSSRTRR